MEMALSHLLLQSPYYGESWYQHEVKRNQDGVTALVLIFHGSALGNCAQEWFSLIFISLLYEDVH